MAASQRLDFAARAAEGDIVELVRRVTRAGGRATTIEVELSAEHASRASAGARVRTSS